MANPSSRFTAFRRLLASAIEPRPDAGEGWCVNCRINDDHTFIINADAIAVHVAKHSKDDRVCIEARWNKSVGTHS